tara:strand:- start:1500 stop:2441 length:942 start_codon:yes stop_codon:yes gene_type:complete
MVAFSFVILDSIYQYFANTSLFGNIKPSSRLTGPFGDRQIVGSYLARLSALLFFLYYFFPFKLNTKFLVLAILIAVTVLLSGERTSFFLITFIFVGISFIIFSFKNFLLSFFTYFLLTILIISSSPSIKERIVTQTLKGLAISQTKLITDGEKNYFKNKPKKGFYVFSGGHEAHYLAALSIFSDNKIFGAGPNMFRKVCSDSKHFKEPQSCTTHPHNFMLQILAEIGIVGFIFFMFALAFFLKKIIKYLGNLKFNNKNQLSNLKNIKTLILDVGFLANIFIIFLPSGNFFNNYLCATIFLPLGFYLHNLNNNE